MKKIFLACITFSLLFLAVSCDKDLPYPIDQVERGVLIDVSRVAGTDGVLADGLTSGNYKLKLTIPPEQGDYSFMKCAQLLAVIQWADGKWSSSVAVDNITQFPLEINLNIADVYSKFSQSAPGLGQTLYLTANVVRNDGYTIPGWTELMGFNNVAFAGWMVDGKAYSNRVRYAVACPFDKDPDTGTFIGTFVCDESSSYGDDSYEVQLSYHPGPPPESAIPPGVTAANLYGIDITPVSPNIWEPSYEVVTVWINAEDLSMISYNQTTGDKYSNGMDIMWCDFRNMSVNTCTGSITFETRPYMPGYGGWGYFSFTIHP